MSEKQSASTDSYDMVSSALELISEAKNFNQWMFSRFSDHIDYNRVWEIGSGIGNISTYLEKSKFLCVSDYEKPFLQHLEERYHTKDHIEVRFVDLEKLDIDSYKDFNFSCILCINVLEHIKNHAEALKGLSKIMSPESKLILLVPAHPVLYGSMDKEAGHHRRYTLNSLRFVLEDAGQEVITHSYFNRLSAFFWFLKGRVLKQRNIQSHDVKIVERLVPLLKMESLFPLPFGQSLITVSRLKS